MDKSEQILSEHKNAHIVKCAVDANKLLKGYTTKTYVYVMIADNEIVILGEGSGARGYVMFPGRCAPAHLKAITAALTHKTAKDVECIIIPTSSKKESLDIESQLFKRYDFHDVSVDTKNEILLEKRLTQMDWNISNDVKIALMPLLYATGTDMGTYKKYKRHLPEDVVQDISKVFGGYYKDI